MALLTYNGVDLQVEHFTVFEQNPVYSDDGADYLYTHFRIGCKFLWNPEATANAAKALPATSIAEVRKKLLESRKHLFIRFEDGQILSSPMVAPNGRLYSCDANNGPKPLRCSVMEFHGTKSAIGFFEIETWVNECDRARIVLSNRWSMQSDIDSNYYTTRTIIGKAVFRTDLLFSRPLPAGIDAGAGANWLLDDFRSMFIPAVPRGFRRTHIVVGVASDNTELTYQVTDEEQTLSIMTGGVDAAGRPGPPENLGITAIKGTMSQGHAMGNLDLIGVAKGAATGAAGSGIGAAIGAFSAASGAIFPSWWASINVRAWGNKFCPRHYLVSACLRAAQHWNWHNLGNTGMGYTAAISIDIVDKYSELTAGVQSGGPTQAAGALFGVEHDPLKMNLFTAQTLPEGMDGRGLTILPNGTVLPALPGVAQTWDRLTNNRPMGAFAPNDNRTRGTYVGKLWAQSLLPACAYPWEGRSQDDHLADNFPVVKVGIYN